MLSFCGTLEVLLLVLIPEQGGDLTGLGIRVDLRFFSSVGLEAGLALVPCLSDCNLRLAGRISGLDDLRPGAVFGLVDDDDLAEFAAF